VGQVIVVSDTHLSPRVAESDLNWSSVLRYVASAQPDLVVHTGDLSMDGAHDQADLEYARSRLDRLAVPWLAVPGNHDVGDNPSGAARDPEMIDVGRRERWLSVVGPDRWTADLDGWRLIGVNAQLFGSGLAAEADQWAWLAAEFRAAPASFRHALVMHKPVAAPVSEMAGAPAYRFIPAAARSRLADLARARPVDLVLTGHVHQYRELCFDGTTHLWAPTTWAVLPETAQPTFGLKRSGILVVGLAGAGDPRHAFVEPDGLRQLTLTADVPNPYSHA
jgi:3',5'-cyclic AMP phosphodiesterase CpdA